MDKPANFAGAGSCLCQSLLVRITWVVPVVGSCCPVGSAVVIGFLVFLLRIVRVHTGWPPILFSDLLSPHTTKSLSLSAKQAKASASPHSLHSLHLLHSLVSILARNFCFYPSFIPSLSCHCCSETKETTARNHRSQQLIDAYSGLCHSLFERQCSAVIPNIVID